ncbi:MAG: discoidin domain-containing protein [Verrucomicrobiales bacterium]
MRPRKMAIGQILLAPALLASLTTVSSYAQSPGWDIRELDLTSAGGFEEINDQNEADRILDDIAAANIRVEGYRTGTRSVIDFAGGGGTFGVNNTYLDGTTVKDDVTIRATAKVTIPAGTWSIAFGTDDGGRVTVPGVVFSARFNADAPAAGAESTVIFNGTRGHTWTGGTFTLSEPLQTTVSAGFFERGGGESFELAVRDSSAGTNDAVDPANGWELLGDGTFGWSIISSNLAAAENVGGDGRVDVQGVSGALSNLVYNDTITGTGLAQEWWLAGNPGTKSGMDAVFNSRPADATFFGSDNGGTGTWWTGDGGEVIPGVQDYPPAQPFVAAGGNLENYLVRLTGEINIPESGTYKFRDGVDDYTYLAIDLNGNGTIDADDGNGQSEVLIDDNAWTGPATNDNGGSPIASRDITVAEGGAWLAIEVNTGEGGGGDAGVLYWDYDTTGGGIGAGAGFPVELTDAIDLAANAAALLIPDTHLRGSYKTLKSADYTGKLARRVVDEYVTDFTQNGYDGTGDGGDGRLVVGNGVLKGLFAFNGTSPGFADGTFVESVANLGTFQAGEHVEVTFLGAWDDGFVLTPAPNWEINSVQISNGGDVVNTDFTADNGGFSVVNNGNVAGPWVYNSDKGTWSADGGEGVVNSRLSKEIVVPADGPLTLTFTHRYNFEDDGAGGVRWDAGAVFVSVNGLPYNFEIDGSAKTSDELVLTGDTDPQTIISDDFSGGAVNSTFTTASVSGTPSEVLGGRLRVTHLTGSNNNSVAWDAVSVGSVQQAILEFDWNSTDDAANAAGGGCCDEAADGFGIGLFSTETNGTTGEANPTVAGADWESAPGGAGMPSGISVHFDLFDGGPANPNGNNVRVNVLGTLAADFPAPFMLNNNVTHRGIITVTDNGDGSATLNVSIIEDVNGAGTVHNVADIPLAGVDLSTGVLDGYRIITGGRTGGAFVQTDLDNIRYAVVSEPVVTPFIDLNGAEFNVKLTEGKLEVGDVFTLVGGGEIIGSLGKLTLPGGQWDTSGLTAGGDGKIRFLDEALNGWSVRGIDLTDAGGFEQVNTSVEADDFLADLAGSNVNVQSDVTVNMAELDIAGGGGTFAVNNPYPNGVNDASMDDVIVEAKAEVVIPAGTWSIAFGSDDGGRITVDDITFDSKFNEDLDTGSDTVRFDAPRGHTWTGGTFTLAAPLTTTITAVMYERGGGDSFEVAIRDSSSGEDNTVGAATGWVLAENGALGWSILSSPDGIGRHVAGLARIGDELVPGEIRNEIKAEPITKSGLAQEWWLGANPGSKAGIDALFAAAPAGAIFFGSDDGGTGTWWTGDGGPDVIPGVQDYPLAQPFIAAGGNLENYVTRLTGEINIPESGTYKFRDGVDDYTYLAIDLNGNGTIDADDGNGQNEVLIDDNAWTGPATNDNGGSPIAGRDITVAEGGAWLAIEFDTGEGGGGDAGVLYWDYDTTGGGIGAGVGFPVELTDAIDLATDAAALLIPDTHLRGTLTPPAGGDFVGVLNPAIPYEIEVDVATGKSDRLIPANPNAETYSTNIDLNGAHLVILPTGGEIGAGTVLDLFGGATIIGEYGSITLPPGDWDLSGLEPGGNGQISRSANQEFEITHFSVAADKSAATLTWNSQANKTYTLQSGNDLQGWSTVASGIESQGLSSSLTIPLQPFSLGTGTAALLGGDLTDPENDGDPEADVNYNATFNASEEAAFGGGESAFNIFDNEVGGGNSKWCCGTDAFPLWAEATFPEAHVLTHFTVASGNDTPGRDPRVWEIQGSNDGVTYTTIFRQEDTTAGLWEDTRDEVLLFQAGIHFDTPAAYTTLRFITFETGLTTGAFYQLSEVEFFSGDNGTWFRMVQE